jgi:hypothetical protein
MKNRLSGIILIIFVLSVIPIVVSAQTGSSARLSTPAIESFPQIDAYLDVKDSQGDFVHGLQTNHVEVLENGRSLPVASIEELRSGVQVVVALNPGQPLVSGTVRESRATITSKKHLEIGRTAGKGQPLMTGIY